MALNPNWPVVETAWGPYWTCNGGEVPPDRYVDISKRMTGQFTGGRGKQYEMDAVQAGTSTMTLSNTDGALDPDNAAGPWAGHIQPFQPIRRRAQWPPTINRLNQAQATGGDTGGQPLGAISTADNGPRILSQTDATGGQFVASGTAWQGSTVAAFAVPAASTAGQWICSTAQPAVRPGQAYTVQLRVRNLTPGTTVSVAAGFRTATVTDAAATTAAGATSALVGNATAAWTQVTVTATAAATSSGMVIGVQVVTAPGAAATVQVDGWQLEEGPAASAWVQPGVWYPIISHFTNGWPSQWQLGGTYGVVTPQSVDSFALLSQFTLPDPLTAEINSHSPRFLFRLNDPAGSTTAADATGAYAPAPVARGKYGAGTITFGTDVTAADPAGGVFSGTAGPVVHIANASPGTNILAGASYISLDAVGIKGPANMTGDWTRVLAFRYTGPASRPQPVVMWSCFDSQRPVIGSTMEWIIAADGTFQVYLGGPVPGSVVTLPNTIATVDDGNWHLAILVYDSAADTMTVRVDGNALTYTHTASGGILPTGLTSDSLGNYVDKTNGGGTTFNWAGDLSFAAEFPAALTATDRTNLYTAWKTACAGESTDARYRRILRYAGYQGPTAIQAGLTTSMGPAAFAGQDAVTALQAVADTEGGQHFVDGSSTVTLLSRRARYNALLPVYTFGENVAGGEFPYEDCQPDYDSTHLGNIAQVTQEGTGQVFTAQDATSIGQYFPRTLTRTVNASNPLEVQDASNYIKSRYAQPATRVASMKLHPSAYPALWPVCLALELGTRVRVMRRPNGAPAIQIEAFVENLAWTHDDKGDAVLIVQCSPADTTLYGMRAAWHTVTFQAYAAGVSGIAVKPNGDSANPLATQIAPGTTVVIEPGGANQESFTVSAVGATSPGWTSGVLASASATTKAHAAGVVICEALPAGITAPATWDAAAMFDAKAFAY